MKQKTSKFRTMPIETQAQRRAIASPLRMELLGLFTDGKPLTVAEIAERMGRTATAMHYHVSILAKAGILRRTGQKRTGQRPETMYEPAADMFRMEPDEDNPEENAESALKTMSTAFRMAESDMRASLGNPDLKSSGPYRNIFGARFHCRLSKKEIAELNRHLRAIEKMLSRGQSRREPSANDSFLSLTLALMPLRNREVRS